MPKKNKLNLFYTDDEIYYMRQNTTKYITNNDVFTNSFGEKTRIIDYANDFLSTPTAWRYNPNLGVTGAITTAIFQRIEDIISGFQKNTEAAFLYFLNPVTYRSMGDLVKTELLYHANLTSLDFSNANRWVDSGYTAEGTPLRDEFFSTAAFFLDQLRQYSFTRNLFSSAEKITMEKYFFWIADYGQRRNIDSTMNTAVPNRAKGDYTNTVDTLSADYLYRDATGAGVNLVRSIHKYCNNRRVMQVFQYVATGLFFKHFGTVLTPANIGSCTDGTTFATQNAISVKFQTLIDSGYQYCMDTFAIGTFPNHFIVDFSRGTTAISDVDSHEKGTQYVGVVLDILCSMGALQKNCGEKSVFDIETTLGWLESTDGITKKSLKKSAELFCKLYNKDIVVYGGAVGNPVTSDWQLDGYVPTLAGRNYYMCCSWLIPLVQYLFSRRKFNPADGVLADYIYRTYMSRAKTGINFPSLSKQLGIGEASADYQRGGHIWDACKFFSRGGNEFNKYNPYLN